MKKHLLNSHFIIFYFCFGQFNKNAPWNTTLSNASKTTTFQEEITVLTIIG